MIKTLAFNYSVRRSHRAKKTRIIVTPEKIEVVAPLKVSERIIHDFVKSQQDWVLAATDKVEKNQQSINKLTPETYKNGVSVPFRGKQNQIHLLSTESKTISIEFDQQSFNIYLPKLIDEADKHQQIRLSLIKWMKQQMIKDVTVMVDEYSKKYNLFPRSVKIKTQKSRWGSCGIHDDINLNWLLILAPPKVMEYVVIHELCHLKERNHSANFWALVAKYCPDYKEHRLWLKKNGRSVMQGM